LFAGLAFPPPRSAVDTVVPARGKALVKTGLSVAIPEGTYARIAPRSGLAWKNFIDTGAGVRCAL
jgi:dUTP pyrophosphatase